MLLYAKLKLLKTFLYFFIAKLFCKLAAKQIAKEAKP